MPWKYADYEITDEEEARINAGIAADPDALDAEAHMDGPFLTIEEARANLSKFGVAVPDEKAA